MPFAKTSYWLALLATLVVIGWLASGKVSQATTGLATREQMSDGGLSRVAYRVLTASVIDNEVRAEGQVEADRAITVRARIDSVVKQLPVDNGTRVARASLLVELDAEDLPARIASAKAAVELARSEMAAAKSLSGRGLMADTDRQQRVASLASAEAQLASLETLLGYTTIRAPFAGLVDLVAVDAGESVRSGDMLLRLIDDERLLMVGQVPQQSVSALKLGLSVRGRLLSGQDLHGRLTFIRSEADPATRTYRVEAAFDNPKRLRLAGSTVSLAILLGTVEAQQLSPADLTLDRQGRLSVQHLSEDDVLLETPVERVKATAEAVWVTGLPRETRLVTLGKGFAPVGSKVEAVEESTLSSRTSP